MHDKGQHTTSYEERDYFSILGHIRINKSSLPRMIS